MFYTNSTWTGIAANGTRYIVSLWAVFLASQSIAIEINKDVVRFEPTTCWNKVESEAVTDCGWLNVSEDWNAPQASKLKLPVVIYRPLNPDPSLSPIIFLAGGPGGHPSA